MATSGYGNRLAVGNQFFQGPRGPVWRLAPGGRAASRGSSPPWGGTKTLPNLELPTSPPPSNLSPGPGPSSAAHPPPLLKRPPHPTVNRWTNYQAAAGELAGTSLLKLCVGRGRLRGRD